MFKLNYLRNVAILMAMTISITNNNVEACTGIGMQAEDGSKVIARTMEWGTFVLEAKYSVVPRGYTQTALTPTGTNGLKFTAKYGYAGISALEDRFVVEGLNEKGLVAELFYFPNYGKCEDYDPANNATTITDVQLIPWMLGNFATIEEMEKEIGKLHIIPYGHGFDNVHWNVGDRTGRQVVIEIINKEVKIFENEIEVITNAPSFDWQMTNLNNYVNIFAGSAPTHELVPGVTLRPFGIGSASLGLPGDLTPPSRFVRAAFYKLTARPQKDGEGTVLQAFQILNNFDVPVGAEFSDPQQAPEFLSATQWTAAVDLMNLKFYYKTEWNYTIRCIDLSKIDFSKVKFQSWPLDKVKKQPIEYIPVK